MSGLWVALVLALQPQPRIVVTAAGALDAQRLSDALHAYLGDVEIEVENAPTGETGDIRQRMAEARRLGESVRALAVIHAQGGSLDAIEIELDDLTTQKTLIATVPKPPRDEDLYRTLALKVQSLLRATLSEARDTLDPASPAGRLAAQSEMSASAAASASPAQSEDPLAGRLALETGYQALSLTAAGRLLQGLSAVVSWKIGRRFDVAVGTAALGSTDVSSRDVHELGEILPVFGAARARWGWRHVELLVGPSLEIALASVSPLPVMNSPVTIHASRDIIVALGAEGEARVAVGGPFALYARGDLLGVLYAPSYDISGMSALDTSRLHVAASAGLGIVFP